MNILKSIIKVIVFIIFVIMIMNGIAGLNDR